jgi:hypothetical protein
VNQARADAKVTELHWDSSLTSAAVAHAVLKGSGGPISHGYPGELDLPERAAQAGAHFSLIEETDAVAPTVAAIDESWMHSPENRAVLLNPDIDRVGIAVVASGDGGYYAVANFERSGPALMQAQVEDAVTRLLHTRIKKLAVFTTHVDARAYCAQTTKERVGSKPHYQLWWEGSDLTYLPPELLHLIASGYFDQIEVGSCPVHHPEGSYPTYRVGVLLYYDTSSLPEFMNPQTNF